MFTKELILIFFKHFLIYFILLHSKKYTTLSIFILLV